MPPGSSQRPQRRTARDRARLRLVHWHAAEASDLGDRLCRLGFDVDARVPSGREFLAELKADPPAVLVISLERLPAQGRDLALAVRHQAATRSLPIVFVDGDPAALARILRLLPGAVCTDWSGVGAAVAEAQRSPVLPLPRGSTVFAAYAGRPLAAKLGFRPATSLRLVNAPNGFLGALGPLPDGARVVRRRDARADLTVWFVGTRAELASALDAVAAEREGGPVWLAWPKRAAGTRSELSQQVVRAAGLDAGLVDYKICSIDAMWSALLFTRRADRARG